MNTEFHVEIVSCARISEITNGWSSKDYMALLAMMDITEDELGGMDESEIREMCLMSLNDFEHHESASFVLSHIFKEDISAGKIDQLSHQMAESNLWEEHADPAYHFSLFKGYGLLRKAYNGIFREPTGVKFTVKITTQAEDSLAIFTSSPHAAVVRVLSAGLGETAILNRLYEEQINGSSFPDAGKILWVLHEVSATEKERVYEVISSEFWFGALEEGRRFTGTAHSDASKDEMDA